MAIVRMTAEEIAAVTEEEIQREIEEVLAEHGSIDNDEDDPDCPVRTMEQLKAMGWHRANPHKRKA